MTQGKILLQLLTVSLLLSGCFSPSLNFAIPTASITPTATSSATPKATSQQAVKIIFKSNTNGSFDLTSPYSNGTATGTGNGLPATRFFNADGSPMPTQPQWLSLFELGISGSANTSAPTPACANFADTTEETTSNCLIGNPAAAAQCGANNNQFRVSEWDCSLGTSPALTGNGSSTDGVYFRATFNRNSNYMNSTDNILVNIEYAASALNPGPSSPTNCFYQGTFQPEYCSDFVWRAYIKHTSSETVQPFLLLVPPTFASVLGPTQATNSGGGVTVSTRQFILPFSGDQNLTIFQVTRTQSNFPGSKTTPGTSAYNLNHYCNSNSLAVGGTPLCAGIIFYSVTFFRI